MRYLSLLPTELILDQLVAEEINMTSALNRKYMKREAELHAIHEDILHCINSQSRRVKVERLVTVCNETFVIVVDKNEDLIAFAGKTEDRSAPVPSLDSYFEAMTFKNDKILTSARNTSILLMIK